MARKQDEEKRKNIIESAIGIFGEKGFTESSIKDICDDAGLSPGTVYTYFENKEELFRCAVDEGWNKFLRGMERLRDDHLPFEKKILWLIDFGFDVIKELHPLLRGMYSDAARRSLIRTRLDDIIDMLRDITFDGDSSRVFGMYRDEKIRDFLLRSIVQGVFFDLSTTTAEDLDEETNRLRQLLKQGLETMTL